MNVGYRIPENESIDDYNLPAMEIDHDEIGAISSVIEYTGTQLPTLKGKVLFCSISVAKVFFVEEKDLKEGQRAKVRELPVP